MSSKSLFLRIFKYDNKNISRKETQCRLLEQELGSFDKFSWFFVKFNDIFVNISIGLGSKIVPTYLEIQKVLPILLPKSYLIWVSATSLAASIFRASLCHLSLVIIPFLLISSSSSSSSSGLYVSWERNVFMNVLQGFLSLANSLLTSNSSKSLLIDSPVFLVFSLRPSSS